MTQPAAITPPLESALQRVTHDEFLAIKVGDLVMYDTLDPLHRRRMWVLRMSEERGDIIAFQNGDPADMPVTAARWDQDNHNFPGFLWHNALLGVGMAGSLTLVATDVPSRGGPNEFAAAVERGTMDSLAARIKVSPAE